VRDLKAAPPRAVAAVVPVLLAAWLCALPIRGTVALRNVLLWSAVALLIAAAWRQGAWRRLVPPRPLLVAIFAWSAWCIASLAWSVTPGASLAELRPELATPLAAFVAFLACTDRPSRIDLWSAALAAALAVLAALAIQQQLADAWDPHRWHVDVGYYSTFVVLALPWLAWLAWRHRGIGVRLVLAAVAAGTLLTTWWTDNRVVWPTLAAMVLVGAVLAARGAPRRERIAWAALAVAALAATAALFVAAQHERAESLRRVAAPVTPDFATDPRLRIWPEALARWGERPVAGFGFGRPAIALPARAPDGIQDPRFWHAHNVFLDVGLQLGAVGLGIFLAGLFTLAIPLATRGLASASPRREIAIVGLAVLVGFVAKNFTDDFLTRHVALLCAALAGVLAAAMREDFAATP